MANKPLKNKHKPRVGVGLSLEKFAKAKLSKYDKREVKEKARQVHLNRLAKYRKLKTRLQKQGRLPLDKVDDEFNADERPSISSPKHSIENREVDELQEQAHPNAVNAPVTQNADPDNHKQGKHKKKKPPSSLQRLAAKMQVEKAAEREHEEEVRREIAARQEVLQAASKRRKEQQQRFRKKTRSGQPLMSVRMGKILDKLQQ